MKKIKMLGILLFFGLTVSAQKTEVKWLNFEQAVALNEKHPKKILVDVYTNWCYYCKVMDKKTYSNPKVAAYINEHFYPVKFNAEQKESIHFNGKEYDYKKVGRRGYNEFASALLEGKLSFPNTVFFDKNNQVITRLPGYLTIKNYEPILVFLAEDYYLTKNWNDFLKNYKPTF